MAATRSNESDPNSTDAGDAGGTVAAHPLHLPPPASSTDRIVPDAVAQRFLHIGERYFFADRTPAFTDTGARLKVHTHNLEVVHSIVAIMQARGWQSVQLTGTSEFRQKVWHEATLQGISVQGYAPSALEIQQLQRALDRAQAMRSTQAPAQDLDPVAVARAGSTASADPSHDHRPSHAGLRAATVGLLLAHAAAPYRFDPMQRMSYYVRVQTEVGERTVWGADLERALAESRSAPQIGDEVVLSQRGVQPVTVRVPDRDGQGALVGEKKLTAQKTVWQVETVPYMASLDRQAALVRNGELAASALLSQHPELTGAVAGLKLAAQFAQRLTPRAEDQARLLQAIRSGLADAIAQGQQIHLPAQRVRQAPAHHRGRAAPERDEPNPSRA